MSTGNRSLMIGLMLKILLSTSDLYAAEPGSKDADNGKHPIRVSVEYLSPTEDSRNIRTINLNAYYLVRKIKTANISIYAGLTATYANGDIMQLEGDINQGTLREVKYENEAAGIGPGMQADFRFWSKNKLSLHLDVSGSVIFYNKDFPAGGGRYNFMWRGGASLSHTIGTDQDIGIGYHLMHVSNGQGLGPQNPSYGAQGVSLQYSVAF